MSTEWNEETVRPHLFTEVEVSDIGNLWSKYRLDGFWTKTSYPFLANGTSWKLMRLIPKPTKRLMKPIELANKWLDFGDDGMAMIVGFDHDRVMMHSDMFSVEELNCHDYGCQGWRDTPTSELNTSFEVDE